jgi:hypothetical protein
MCNGHTPRRGSLRVWHLPRLADTGAGGYDASVSERASREPRSPARKWLARRRNRLTRLISDPLGGGAPGASGGGIDRPPPAPACPPGWRTGPPDFVGVGVQRCGTTRWFDLIASHPQVTHSVAAKELHYFDRFYSGRPTQAEIDGYQQYFPRPARQLAGEWTPLYLTAPWIPPLLAAAAPEARLLVLLRDPVERYLSGLQLATRVAARRGVPLSRYAPLDTFVRGLYHAHLTGLLRHFPRSQILLLQYEQCTRDPIGELRRTLEFIGLEDIGFEPDTQARPQEQSEKPRPDSATRAAYVEAYSDDVARLLGAFPEIDVSLWPNFAHM